MNPEQVICTQFVSCVNTNWNPEPSTLESDSRTGTGVDTPCIRQLSRLQPASGLYCIAMKTVTRGNFVRLSTSLKAHLYSRGGFPTGYHLSNQRTFIYFCVTPERYRARSLRWRFPDGKPLARRARDQSALLFWLFACCWRAGLCRPVAS